MDTYHGELSTFYLYTEYIIEKFGFHKANSKLDLFLELASSLAEISISTIAEHHLQLLQKLRLKTQAVIYFSLHVDLSTRTCSSLSMVTLDCDKDIQVMAEVAHDCHTI